MSWIEEVQSDEATGKVQELFDRMNEQYEMEPNVLTILSKAPSLMEEIFSVGSEVLTGEGPLERRHREMIAVRVSSLNECHY